MKRPGRTALIVMGISGLLPLGGLFSQPIDTTLLIYSLFVAAYLIYRPIAGDQRVSRRGRPVAFIFIYIIVGLLVECLAWTGHYLQCSPAPELLHPQLIPDLVIGFGFYAGAGLAWAWLMWRFGFSLLEVFVLQGLYGVFLEQLGAVFIAGLGSLPLGALLWLYVFAVYGSIPALARVFADPGLSQPVQRVWWHWLAALAVAPAATFIGTYVVGFVTLALGGLPDPGNICIRPFF